MAFLTRACLIVVAVIAATFLPFLSGGYDLLAAPLASMAWALGRVGLLLVPLGALWLWASTRPASSGPPGWLIGLTLAACALIALTMLFSAFAATSSPLLAVGTATIGGIIFLRVARRLHRSGPPLPKRAALALMLAPLVVWAAQSALIGPLTLRARNRAIENAAPLIAEIESYRARNGAYPASLFSIWGDVKPAIQGIERYRYEPSGEAYNLIFQEPALEFGIRRFVAYNPSDKQRITVHEQDRLRLDEAGLDADNAGYTVAEPLPQPHWKLFTFLS